MTQLPYIVAAAIGVAFIAAFLFYLAIAVVMLIGALI